MDKETFITNLQVSLSGKVSDEKAQKVMDYYNGYIESQMENGRDEEELIAELGNPGILVKSIVETDKCSKSGFSVKKRESGSLIYGERYISGRLLMCVLFLILFVIFKVVAPILSSYGKLLFTTVFPVMILFGVLIWRFKR